MENRCPLLLRLPRRSRRVTLSILSVYFPGCSYVYMTRFSCHSLAILFWICARCSLRSCILFWVRSGVATAQMPTIASMHCVIGCTTTRLRVNDLTAEGETVWIWPSLHCGNATTLFKRSGSHSFDERCTSFFHLRWRCGASSAAHLSNTSRCSIRGCLTRYEKCGQS